VQGAGGEENAAEREVYLTGESERESERPSEREREREKEGEKEIGSGRMESSAERTNGDGGRARFKHRRSIKSLIKGLRNQISLTK